MKTLLIALYPYNEQGIDSWHDHSSGMTYTAAKLAGCDIDFLDLKTLKNDQELTERMKGYDLIAFGLKSVNYPLAMKVIKFAKSQFSQVIVGGYHATAAPSELLENPNIDYIFHGESEITFPQFLKNPSKFEREIIGEKVQNLDNLPFMDRSIFRGPLEDCSGDKEYCGTQNWWYGTKLRNMTTVVSSRGCPYRCTFCQPLEDNHFGKKLRRRSVNSIITELKQIKELYNPECLMIHDDTFFLQVPWLEEFIERYPEINLPFWAAARADGICRSPDLFKRLVKVGWDIVSVGFEVGSQRILDKLKKGYPVEQNLEAARIIKSTGAKIYANCMIGLPWETKSDIQASAKMFDEIAAEMPRLAYFTPYPGCELAEECNSNNWSLLTRNTYDRTADKPKVENVNYNYVNRVFYKGLRESHSPILCDIITPTYNNEEYTVACFNSIKKFTTPGTYRIIWVDNGSKDTSKVEAVLKGTDHIFIKLTKNEGFVGATNRGILASTSPFVCLLNNDTEVSDKWLSKLIATLVANDKLGILGPLTQPLPYSTDFAQYDSYNNLTFHPDLLPKTLKPLSLPEINSQIEKKYKGQTTSIPYVAFLCAVIKREIIDKVGLLDTHYAMGMYDDNDYNLEVRKLGYQTELAIDTCIYHRGRTTFKLIEKTENFDVQDLLRKNLLYLNQKWGLTKGRIVLGGSRANPSPDGGRDNWRSRISAAREAKQARG